MIARSAVAHRVCCVGWDGGHGWDGLATAPEVSAPNTTSRAGWDGRHGGHVQLISLVVSGVIPLRLQLHKQPVERPAPHLTVHGRRLKHRTHRTHPTPSRAFRRGLGGGAPTGQLS
jgi:hypothetical protein